VAAGWSRCCRAEPGSILADPVRELCLTGPDQAGVTRAGHPFHPGRLRPRDRPGHRRLAPV